ncbi:MAG: TIGR02391 family protein [Acidimicrobiia bacterium]
MADDTAVRAALKRKMSWSAQNLTNRVTRLINDHHLMSRRHALYVLANQHGIPLERYGVDDATLIEVGSLVRAIAAGSSEAGAPPPSAITGATTSTTSLPVTPAQKFAARDLHDRVVRSSRLAFTSGLRTEAVRKAFQSVNNRVKRLTHSTADGKGLMGSAFRDPPDQQLQMTDLTTTSEKDEHEGLRFLMQGAIHGIRNPRSHDDDWEPDQEEAAVLELLGLASWLHRCLDRCETYSVTP